MTIGLPKPVSRAQDTHDAKVLADAYRRVIYRLVNKRDGYRCRCCSSNVRLHHHHLKYRSRGGRDSERNIVLLCGWCHADIHAHRLYIHGTDANGVLTFERP